MLDKSQMLKLVILSLVLWVLAMLFIRLFPTALTDPWQGAIGFVTTLPIAWASVRITKAAARLRREQLLSGVCLVGAVAMMVDGAALRWYAPVYGDDPLAVRLGAAWLLWSYGVSFAVALWMALGPKPPAAKPR